MYYGRKAEPKSSKLLYDREIAEKQRRHRQRLRSMKASVDNRAPKRPKHMQRNLKREYMMEERYAKIEHENRLLLAKMSDIMRRGSLDMVSKSHKYGHSMNRTSRKKELQRITQENQKILRRLYTVQPVYSHWKWEESRIKEEKYLETISEFKTSAPRKGEFGGRHSSAEGYTRGSDMGMGGGYEGEGGADMGMGGYDAGMGGAGGMGGTSYGMGHGTSAPALMAPSGGMGAGMPAGAAAGGGGGGGADGYGYGGDAGLGGGGGYGGAPMGDGRVGGSAGMPAGSGAGYSGGGGGGLGASYSRGSLGAAGARAMGSAGGEAGWSGGGAGGGR